jgi:hypothetical protein
MEFSMEFHGIQWNSMDKSMENLMEIIITMEFHRKMFMKKIRQMFMWDSMDFHGKFNGIRWNGIPWNSVN